MLTTVLFHCVFNKDLSITYFMEEDVDEVTTHLPNLYVVSLCQREQGNIKNIVGAMIVRTSLSHNEQSFSEALYDLCLTKKELSPFMSSKQVTFLPAIVSFDGDPLLKEEECIEIVTQQYWKHFQTVAM
ncbi:hypothetical protein [Vibrio jasicida]|uniref:hypothetical protein n=1 Tax=Vibrio jasicida TaxID=766224 RepID=UPI004068CFCD